MKTVDWLIKSFIYPFYASHRNIVGVWVIEYLKKNKTKVGFEWENKSKN